MIRWVVLIVLLAVIKENTDIVYLLFNIFSFLFLSFARCVRSRWIGRRHHIFLFILDQTHSSYLYQGALVEVGIEELSAFEFSELSWKSLLDGLDLFRDKFSKTKWVCSGVALFSRGSYPLAWCANSSATKEIYYP